MRTWRQGVIGRAAPPDRPVCYLRCLTYPLAQRFEHFEAGSQRLSQFQGLVRIRLADFAWIERVGDSKLTAAERRMDTAAAAWTDWT